MPEPMDQSLAQKDGAPGFVQDVMPPRSGDGDGPLALTLKPPTREIERLKQALKTRVSARSYDRLGVSEAVIGLREWGGKKVFPLCSLRTSIEGDDSQASVHIVCEGGLWHVRDPHGVAGLQVDGVSSTQIVLFPGAELSIGGLTLIAESASTIALRQYCRRLLGWGDRHRVTVDRAMRSLRLWALRRAPLYLQGEGDMMSLARSLHRYAMNESAPFVVCDSRRQDTAASVRCAANVRNARSAMRRAAEGTLCMRASRLPGGLPFLMDEFRKPGNQTSVIICVDRGLPDYAVANWDVLDIPSLAKRPGEVERVVEEYFREARIALNVPDMHSDPSDVRWVSRMSARSIPEIEKGTMRVTAIRTSVDLGEAAERLGMAPVSLDRWLARRSRDPKSGSPVSLPSFA